ncbi:MAG: hypothetical protein HOB40_06990 [Candidatus Marinimicrobia bacterium]|jgi:hypothetical protein|nr:hypothetical protein [Candidatus Neomarinimicrobiota bacterium]MBT3838673.1 hypothetical protein [Candidatus Neomarinimicrobiota bacterium]MBT4000233.1 hypothetical protein [Candidatus Neomarinimicrobiota bacterium]MBT4283662.1 hypothetical protein [Candidatus Neomarinimicrobiota bacterium]MBT4580086.1 hypothetical protein [Candidatus Neomarinimicrobiota bacterium]
MILSLPSLAKAKQSNNQSISFYTGTGIPIMGLNSWYNITPVMGIQYSYHINDDTELIYEFHYKKYNHGDIENRSFLWVVDYEYYKSDQASANMSWNDFIFKVRKHLKNKSTQLSGKRIIPSFSYGFGFYNYAHKVKGLIYPGQYIELDESFLMEPIIDRRVAWGGNLGLGATTSFNEKMDIRIGLSYHNALGYVRSFEDWELFEVVPLQFLTFELGIKYNY